eukprot:scaffold31707_cov124-Isochrysis_galbana.AAC.1
MHHKQRREGHARQMQHRGGSQCSPGVQRAAGGGEHSIGPRRGEGATARAIDLRAGSDCRMLVARGCVHTP